MSILSTIYKISEGELISKSKNHKTVFWKGKPKGFDVIQVLPINNSDDCIVLLDWLNTGLQNQKNLMRLDLHGNIIWEVGEPSNDCSIGSGRESEIESYTGITRIEEFQLITYAYSGYADYIDLKTGGIIKSEFVK